MPWTLKISSYGRGDWVENDYNDLGNQDPDNGSITVVDGAGTAGFLSFKSEQDDAADNNFWIYREADLSGGVTAATLSYTLLDNGFDGGETLLVQASNNGGTSWTTLQTIDETTALQAYNYDLLSALGTVGSQTQVRFMQTAANGDNKELRFDDVQISWTMPPGAGGDSSLSATPHLVSDGDTVTVTLTVSSGGILNNITPSAPTVVNAVGGATCTGITGSTVTINTRIFTAASLTDVETREFLSVSIFFRNTRQHTMGNSYSSSAASSSGTTSLRPTRL